MSSQIKVKISRSAETLFECCTPDHQDKEERPTAALVSALDTIQLQVNQFLTELISKEMGGKILQVVSDSDDEESEDDHDDDGKNSDSNRAVKRPGTDPQVNSEELLEKRKK